MKNKDIRKKLRKSLNRKSQMWISDYTLSLLLFILAILLSVKIVINGFSANADFTDVKKDAFKISETLLSEGYPKDWTNDTVIRPGLLTSKRLDFNKTLNAMNSSYINYTILRTKLQTKYDFAIVFEEPNGNIIDFNRNGDNLCLIGKSSVTINKAAPDDCVNLSFSFSYHNLAQLNRFVAYNSSIKRMVVYVWN